LKNNLKNKKALQQKAKGQIFIYKWWSEVDDFRYFCISDKTEKVYYKLEKVTELLKYYNLLLY